MPPLSFDQFAKQAKPSDLAPVRGRKLRARKPGQTDPLAAVKNTGDLEADCKTELTALQQAFRDRAKAVRNERADATDSEYWVCLCFKSREQVEWFLEQSGWAGTDAKYIDGAF